MHSSSARQYFYQEIQQSDKHINLAKAALYIAQEEYPRLDPQEYLNALDTMAGELRERLPPEYYPLKVIQTINQYLYDDLGFQGNKNNYYDPCNSFLNDVIDKRQGIPISLALVYVEIAQRINFPMEGIGMPGHFLIRPQVPDMEIFVDVFEKGEIMFGEDCQEKLTEIYQTPVTLQPEFLAPVTKKQFLMRMLNNLKYIYLNQQDLEKALAAVERIVLLFPEFVAEIRDRGLLSYQTGRFTQAIRDLETYLVKFPQARDADMIRSLLTQMGR